MLKVLQVLTAHKVLVIEMKSLSALNNEAKITKIKSFVN